jgi:hypothetical protein
VIFLNLLLQVTNRTGAYVIRFFDIDPLGLEKQRNHRYPVRVIDAMQSEQRNVPAIVTMEAPVCCPISKEEEAELFPEQHPQPSSASSRTAKKKKKTRPA